MWTGKDPVFADCDRGSFQLDCDDAARRLGKGDAILATHVFGAPCAPERVEALAAASGARLFFDAAAAFGATHKGRAVGGYGAAEVFSLTPTKPLIAGEGGLVTTDDDDLAEAVRLGREYGNPGDYDTRFVGLNGRLSEMHAAVALESFVNLDAHLDERRAIAAQYIRLLSAISGIATQQVGPEDAPSWKDFTIVIDRDRFGLDRDLLVKTLRADGVDTRCYFHPPVHRQRAYADAPPVDLPSTDAVAECVISLPIYPGLSDADIEQVCAVIAEAHQQADRIKSAVAQ
jgi:dTDP-4-amino-4,6-dideoxygalactose transaminase